MAPTEETPLFGSPTSRNKSISKEKMRTSMAAIGGSDGIGTFKVDATSETGRSFSIAGLSSITNDGTLSITPAELGKQELYEQIPFAAIAGLQKKEKSVSTAFANYAAEVDMQSSVGQTFSPLEQQVRKSALSIAVYDELQFESSVLTTPLIMAMIESALCNFLIGYNTSVLNAPEAVIFPGHSLALWSLAIAALPVGSPFGAMYAGSAIDKRGRKKTFVICMWIFFIGGSLQTVSWNMYILIISRLILSLGCGMASVLVPIYLGEISPPTLRGAFGTMASFALVCGIFVANLIAFPFTTETLWRVQTSVTAIVAFIQIISSPKLLIESPLWLLQRDEHSLPARDAIKRLRGLRNLHEIETEVGFFLAGKEAQKVDENITADSNKSIVGTVWADPILKKRFLAVILLQVGQQFCGINAVFFYSTSFFNGVLDNPLLGTAIVGFVNVVACYVALLVMDLYSRKTLLLVSNLGMFIGCFIIVTALLGYIHNIYALLAVNIYVFFFEIGMGPIPWLIAPEMFEGSYIPTIMSICSQVNFTCSFIVGLIFPYLNKYLGPYSFGPFACIIVCTFLYSSTCLPSSSEGEPLEKITRDIERRKSQSGVTYEANVENANTLQNEWMKALQQLEAETETEEAESGRGPV